MFVYLSNIFLIVLNVYNVLSDFANVCGVP